MEKSLREQKRLGMYTLPRSVLLPPYLLLTPYFKEFTDGIDSVFGETVDNKIRVLQNLRNMWVTNPALELKALDNLLINFEDWDIPERPLVVQQVNMLGMRLKSSGALSNEDYLRISRHLGEYWFEKGTYAFIEFINFCANSDLRVYKLWSQIPTVTVTKELEVLNEHSVPISGYLRFKGTTIGSFTNSIANSALNVNWLTTKYTPKGSNYLVYTPPVNEPSSVWRASTLEVQVSSPFSETIQLKVFE